ncbi:hypothetical protein EJ05DRAFT_486582 [Pseudovirgaria hyperparasitica]|uniref:MYND-type domain-containing protein n=1 Tax=Pseudovirgaria hyperparasitica TaxID=470096 RepID=A0A6A6W7I3_9PEZI|nr:uncharacterized protein EJ05DRAFT_486582 [Pseudovirgaria hyperparasitica]KAF2757537.1 hypothetical protein EJ05DRAFT_486582 [Pseudovirgaria hyperparasitica]
MWCHTCKAARYCSQKCLIADLSTHKLICKTYKDFDLSERPTHEHKRAILLDPYKSSPTFIWLHCEWSGATFGEFQYAKVESYLGEDACPERQNIKYNKVLKREVEELITVCVRDTFEIDPSLLNSSVSSITAGSVGHNFLWRGPIVVYGKCGLDRDASLCRDIRMSDFKHVVDFFRSYVYKPAAVRKEPQQPITTVYGVRINDDYHKRFEKPRFESVKVSSRDPIFNLGESSDIAELIGIPTLSRLVIARGTVLFATECPTDNQYARHLHSCLHPKNQAHEGSACSGFGHAHKDWHGTVGNVIVVRQDMKPLWPHHMESICHYAHQEVVPILGHNQGMYLKEKAITEDQARAMINRPAFVIYYHQKYLIAQRDAGASVGADFDDAP